MCIRCKNYQQSITPFPSVSIQLINQSTFVSDIFSPRAPISMQTSYRLIYLSPLTSNSSNNLRKYASCSGVILSSIIFETECLNLDYIILQLLKEMPRQLKVTDLAEDLQEQQYEERPIQNFGMHMLQSMGFTKEKGIGKSNKTSLQDVLVLKPRPKGLGLGAQQEKQKPKDPFSPGDYILITEKQHKDLTGIILEVRQNNLLVELFRSKSQIQISKSKVKILTAEEVKQFEEKEKKEEQPQKKKRLKWVVPGLRLKIVDKNSSFYLKKVVVHDLISDRQFECVYDGDYGKSMIRNLREKDVQTVIPKTGEPVLILKGPHQGQKAQVFQRDKKSEKLTVQTMTELELITLAEDDVCEFVEL